MSKIPLSEIDPFKHDLTLINDRGILELYKQRRGWDYSEICGCCGERPGYDPEETKKLQEGIEIILTELKTRGHIPNAKERKAIRQARGKRGRKR